RRNRAPHSCAAMGQPRPGDGPSYWLPKLNDQTCPITVSPDVPPTMTIMTMRSLDGSPTARAERKVEGPLGGLIRCQLWESSEKRTRRQHRRKQPPGGVWDPAPRHGPSADLGRRR